VIVDLHNHYLPLATAQSAVQDVRIDESDEGTPIFLDAKGHSFSLTPDLTDLALQRAAMTRQRVSRRVLAVPPFTFQYELPIAAGLAWSRALNDGIAAAVRGDPESFVGFATVPLQDVPTAIDEAKRAVRELGLRGIEIATNINGVELDDPSLEPFWDQIERLGLPVLIHPHYVAGAGRMQQYHLRNLIGNPLETALAGARLIFGGVMARHPGLAIVLSHGGGALPGIAGRLEQGRRVRKEIVTEQTVVEGLRTLLYDTIVFDRDALRHLVQTVGADRVVLGTDWPFDMGETDPVSFVEGAGLSADHAEIILRNGAKLLAPGM
jgi:aminocarboxymuconate-semialdehyde decarboxylase